MYIGVFSLQFSIYASVGKYLAIILIILFALATVVSQYYLGESNLIYLVKNLSNKKRNSIKTLYKCLFIVGIFMGVYLKTNRIWDIIDYGMVCVGCLNIYAIIKLEKEFSRMILPSKLVSLID